MLGYLSLLSGLSIICFSLLVVKLYWETGVSLFRGDSSKPEAWFAHGVVMAFLATAVNGLAWKVGVRIIDLLHNPRWVDIERVGFAIDLVVAILVVWAAFCHLYAAYLNLTISERKGWNWLTVAFYPKTNGFTKTLHFLLNKVCRRE